MRPHMFAACGRLNSLQHATARTGRPGYTHIANTPHYPSCKPVALALCTATHRPRLQRRCINIPARPPNTGPADHGHKFINHISFLNPCKDKNNQRIEAARKCIASNFIWDGQAFNTARMKCQD